jgi:hypothetical protein
MADVGSGVPDVTTALFAFNAFRHTTKSAASTLPFPLPSALEFGSTMDPNCDRHVS